MKVRGKTDLGDFSLVPMLSFNAGKRVSQGILNKTLELEPHGSKIVNNFHLMRRDTKYKNRDQCLPVCIPLLSCLLHNTL